MEQPVNDKNLDLASMVRSSGELGNLNLEDCKIVNLFLSGDFISRNTNYPALQLGGPWHEEVELNIYIGDAEWSNPNNDDESYIHLSEVIKNNPTIPQDFEPSAYPCDIVGAGGAGGSAMVSEGNIYENGVPISENENYIPAGDGEDGGGALYILSLIHI